MRIANVNTLSALLDRLITEKIKWYFFEKEGNGEAYMHQEKIIKLLNKEIESIFIKNEYDYISEKRTFVNEIPVNLNALIVNDIHIGESDRRRLEETKKDNPDVNVFITQEQRLRTANEGRSKNKNLIDENFKNLMESMGEE